MGLFDDEFEDEAILRIQKFYKIANSLGFPVTLGFSGGKDSQVCYDLCKRSGIPFIAYFNHCFESSETLNFIKTYYPDVVWRRVVKCGFIQNITLNHKGMLPTAYSAYCCSDFKHNQKFVEPCSILGVRCSESFSRKKRKLFEVSNKTFLKHNKDSFTPFFSENCMGVGATSKIQLKPIFDWSDLDVWNYIHKYNLPINPEYKNFSRVGCVVCPKTNISRNCFYLMKYPNLITAFIRARENSVRLTDLDWCINSENLDLSNDKPEYIIRWLNRSFCPMTNKQRVIANKIKDNYYKYVGS